MLKYKNIIGLLIGLIFSNRISAYDDIQYILQEKLSSPQVRWDEIIGKSPCWLSSIVANNDGFIKMPIGKEIIIRMNRDSILRIHSKNQLIHPSMFDVLVSNGTGLYIYKELQENDNSNDLLLVTEDNPAVVRVSLKNSVKEDIILTFLASRYEPINKLVFYSNQRQTKVANNRLMQIKYSIPKMVDFQSYSHLSPGDDAELTIKGPTRLEISSCFVYEDRDIGTILPYNIRIDLDGKFYEKAAFIAIPDHNRLHLNNQSMSKITP